MVEDRSGRAWALKGLPLTTTNWLCMFIVLCFMLPDTSYGAFTDSSERLEYGFDLFDDHRFKNAETALLELASSSAFRRLDYSQRSLAYAHIAYSKINRGKERESLAYIDKALALTEIEFGERSLLYLDHLETKAKALYWADKRRNAVRTGRTMLKILERMGEDYRDEHAQVRSFVSLMQKVELEEGELPVDLSDFYTDCESIEELDYLTKAHSRMNEHLLVGSDYKPSHKQAQYFKNTYLKNVRESSNDRRTRQIYVPDTQHLKDWCVIYPDGKRVGKTAISAANDR